MGGVDMRVDWIRTPVKPCDESSAEIGGIVEGVTHTLAHIPSYRLEHRATNYGTSYQ